MNTPNPFPGESYLNQVQNGTQYPPDSMFAVGKLHGQTPTSMKVKGKPSFFGSVDSFLGSLLQATIAVACMIGSVAVAAILYSEAVDRARMYNAPVGNFDKRKCFPWHYAVCVHSALQKFFHKSIWCTLASVLPTLVYGGGVCLSFLLAQGFFICHSLDAGLDAAAAKSYAGFETLNPPVLTALFLISAVFCLAYQVKMANLDKPEHWEAARKFAKENPCTIVPVTENDAKLLGWKGLRDYRTCCYAVSNTVYATQYQEWKKVTKQLKSGIYVPMLTIIPSLIIIGKALCGCLPAGRDDSRPLPLP